jgi:O-Antigen ligase
LTDASNSLAGFSTGAGAASSVTLADRLLNVILFVTMAFSSIAFIEPSPHDILMLVLLTACVAARIPFNRKLTPLLVLLLVWFLGGCLALIRVGDEEKTIQYIGTSLYLDIAAIMFACLFSRGDERRLTILRQSYVLAALIAIAAGYIGYFHLLPGSDIFLDVALNDERLARVRATFKDPNVYGPFLIYPLLMLMIGLLVRRLRLFDLLAMCVIAGGLFLSFSRGAWIHFVISATICVSLLFAVERDPRQRTRIIMLGAGAAIGVVLLVIAMLSVDSIHDMFIERAKAIQPYDAGPGGRFTLQRLALTVILDHPNGLGPYGFDRAHGIQQHNEYLQGFLVYGWLGGISYITLIAVTLMVGLRAALIPAAWQPYLAAAYGVFVGELVEGIIVDTDHWRHFFLMLGLIWGLGVASINLRQRQARLYLGGPIPRYASTNI